MYIILCGLIIYVSGIHGLRSSNLDINRIQSLPSELYSSAESSRNQIRRSLETNIYQTNDYDDYSGGNTVLRPPSLHATKAQTQKNTEAPIKIHQPKEDPKLYYQSEAYLKENNGKNVNNEVTYIYPGREVIMANEDVRPLPYYYMKNKNMQRLLRQGPELCIKCPSDRTLITKPGSDRVRLVHPRLTTCAGKRAPKSIRFEHMYGPKFGALVKQGSHVIIGRIIRKHKTLQHCKLLVHVIVQSCPVPEYLKMQCNDLNSNCEFSCRNRHFELSGVDHLKCDEDDMKWNGTLPTCTEARRGCYPLPPPEQGHIGCTGDTDGQSYRLKEGSKCRLQCPAGWRWYPRSVAVCRRGNWTNTLQCHQKLKNIESVS